MLEHETSNHRAPDARDPRRGLSRLLDEGSVDRLLGVRAVVATCGRIAGHRSVAYCSDATGMGEAMAAETYRIIETIGTGLRLDRPVLGVRHSGGAKPADGVESMDGVGRMFAATTRVSGACPISVVPGPAAGAAAYGAALIELVIMLRSGRMLVTGPDMVLDARGEEIDQEGLGGSEVRGTRLGVVRVPGGSGEEACAKARASTGLLGSPDTLRAVHDDDPSALLPENPRRVYDVRSLVHHLLNDRYIEQSQAEVDTQCGYRAGSARRAPGRRPRHHFSVQGWVPRLAVPEESVAFRAQLRRLSCATAGARRRAGLPSRRGQEAGWVVRRGAKLLHAFAEATISQITLITRKSYGGAHIAMNSRLLGATRVFDWPDAEVAVLGAEAAMVILHRRALAHAPDEDCEKLRAEHRRHAGGAQPGVDLDVVDEVVPPSLTRRRGAEALGKRADRSRPSRQHPPLTLESV